MRARHAWLLVPVLAVATWLLIGDRREAPALPETNARQAATDRWARAPVVDQPAVARPARPARVPAPSASATGVAAGAPLASVPGAAASRASASERPVSPPPGRIRPDPAAWSDDAPAGAFNDKTGWSDKSIVKQLNREFMPLASECIYRARDRKPFLTGLLAFTMVITPAGDGKSVVSALKVRPDNKIEDPELWECIRESSFALEGLTAPHDFDITMPINQDDDG